MKKIKYIVFDHDGTLVNTSKYPVSLYEGIKELISVLKEQEVQLFVWTARNRTSTIEILDSLGIITEFKELSCGAEAQAKPSPEGIENMLPGVDPAEVAVIGDSLGDMIGSSSFGSLSIGALWCHADERAIQKYKECGANICFLKIEDCKKYLLEKIRGE